ncbi:MAG: ornithine carbamoyltransferase [Clostridiales bacterium]|jgi:ornithine carbamoyltransferase|nr:ornithine carbamoyltransferase [Clostridiales bacterium]
MKLDLYNYQAEKAFMQKHLIKLQDYSQDEIYQVLSKALELKQKHKEKIPHPYLSGKSLGMIFTKSSTRTRVSFEVGIYQLGGYALFLNANDIQLGRGETIGDTASVLSRYLDGLMIRTFRQEDVEELAQYSSIPVINGLTDLLHPCQVLADLMTIYEKKGALAGLKLAFIGDGNNVCHSLLIGCTKVGMHISVACPEGYLPKQEIMETAMKNGMATGADVLITHDPLEAIRDADVVYTDVWASMGQEEDFVNRVKHFSPYQVNIKLFSHAKDDAIFMHCLPAHRGEEVTSDVIDGPRSVVFDEAENRLHAHKAIMVLLMGDRANNK